MASAGSPPIRYVVVTGGVISGLGKGVTISSVGAILQAGGARVTMIKIDPYLNVDAGTMSPLEHGEVFVVDDGGETDLDLGCYERFLDLTLTSDHNLTTGKVFAGVLAGERRGDYLGKTVQLVPHVTDAIIDHIRRVARASLARTGGDAEGGAAADKTGAGGADEDRVCLVELGGTVGDLESAVFLEALRQLQRTEDVTFLHVSLVLTAGGEQKTKPTQHSVRALRSAGIEPDLLVCRSRGALCSDARAKVAMHCHVDSERVLSVPDQPNLYHVPLVLARQGVARLVSGRRRGRGGDPDMRQWRELAARAEAKAEQVRVALVGKYTGLQDSYLSVLKALRHSAMACGRALVVDYVNAEELEGEEKQGAGARAWAAVRAADGVLVPGGFGDRGFDGKVRAVAYARTARVPFLGVCLGLQCAVVDCARNVLGLAGANSTEFDARARHPVVTRMAESKGQSAGGTLRRGGHTVLLVEGSGLRDAVHGGAASVVERHRHRYEVNARYVGQLAEGGLRVAATDAARERVEAVERPDHPFFVATQYHPEFLTRPLRPAPVFHAFVAAACA